MAIDATETNSPGWWLRRLLRDLSDRRARYERLDRYYAGECDLPESATQHREAYKRFQRKARSNFAELVVEAVRERMQPVGFRTGAQGDENGDQAAWGIWQANALDADAALVHRASLTMGDAYVIVGPPLEPDGAPVITPEDPREVVTAHDPIRRRQVVAALKVFYDDTLERTRAYLYLLGESGFCEIHKASRKGKATAVLGAHLSGWDWESGDAERLDVRAVPVVRFANRADLKGNGKGEFEDRIDVLDRINHMVLQRLIIATAQAFRQRAIKGELPELDTAGRQIDYSRVFLSDPGALWQLPEGAEIWESGQADLGPILSAVRHDIQDLAAMTRTPLFYLTPDAANGSAEGASLAREGLVFKTGDRITQASEAWEQAMSLAFAFTGDTERAKRTDLECLWAPPERFSLAERYDAASKAGAAGVPWRTVMGDVLQFTPQQVERMEAERATDVLLAPVAPAGVGPVVVTDTGRRAEMPDTLT